MNNCGQWWNGTDRGKVNNCGQWWNGTDRGKVNNCGQWWNGTDRARLNNCGQWWNGTDREKLRNCGQCLSQRAVVRQNSQMDWIGLGSTPELHDERPFESLPERRHGPNT